MQYSAEWMRKLSELMMAYPKVRSNDRFHLLGDRFTNLNSSTTQLIAAGIDRGGRRSESYAQDKVSRAPELSKIQFSAIAPREFIPGQYLIINIVVYEENYRHIVNEIIRDYEEKTQEARSGVLKVQEGSTIRIVISSPDYGVEDNEEQGVWNGDYLNLSFALSIPGDYQKNQILYFAQVYINEVLSAKLKFIVKRSAAITQKPEIEREDFTSAFVSYASEDRKRVAGIIQGMKKARPDMDIFFDVESIRSGANWKDILYDEIMKRDVLFLCWSRYAKESKWVDVEWRYALKHHGPDHIDIVPLDQPALCSPPDELRNKNFNERLLYIINSPLN